MTKQEHLFEFSAEQGFVFIIRLLLKYSNINPSFNFNSAIVLSAQNGHTKIVELLLNDERVDPSTRSNCALYVSINKRHIGIMSLLLKNKKVKSVLKLNDISLYSKLIQENTKNKIRSF